MFTVLWVGVCVCALWVGVLGCLCLVLKHLWQVAEIDDAFSPDFVTDFLAVLDFKHDVALHPTKR